MTKFKDKRVDKIIDRLQERADEDESLTNQELVTVEVLTKYLPVMYELLHNWAPGPDDDIDERMCDVLVGTYMAFSEVVAIMQVTMAGRSWDEEMHHECAEVVIDYFEARTKSNLSLAVKHYDDMQLPVGMVGGNDTMH